MAIKAEGRRQAEAGPSKEIERFVSLSDCDLRATTEDVNAAKSLQAAKAAPERVEQIYVFHMQVVGREGNRLQVVFANTGQRTPPMAFNTTFFNVRAGSARSHCVSTCQSLSASWLHALQAFWPLPVPFLPPGISIEINSQELKGWLDLDTGEVDFSFVSEFGGKAFGGANEALKVGRGCPVEPPPSTA
ncbi:hypothetical protein QJQ45_019114 [Haematococcus lacustris]|nr:hypothetical protein QJQ45_019114 [Haematococcus lacustris]